MNDLPPDRAFEDMMTTTEINNAIGIKYITSEPSIASMQATILDLEAKNKQWAVMAERLYDIMLDHESVSDDDWNQGLEDCYQLMMGDIRAANNSNP